MPKEASTESPPPATQTPLPGCDLVMEGGVTSAIIYAALVARLSRHYRLHGLGGTSAGAIAAAAAAIAECTRQRTGSRAAFDGLDTFIERLKVTSGGRTLLRRAFQPAPELRKAFELLMLALQLKWKDWQTNATQLLLAAIARFPLAAAGGLVAAVLTQVDPRTGLMQADDGWALVRTVVAVAIGAILVVLAVVLACLSQLARHLPANDLGLCRGMPLRGDDVQGLTDTLHEFFNGLAGRRASDAPVVFQDLWNPTNDPKRSPQDRAIDLQVITTALHLRRPFRLPGDSDAEPPLACFFYDPKEWERFFPETVMAWLESHALPCALETSSGMPLRALPPPADWPVLVAVRLSLSFPILLSAVPMYVLWQGHGVIKPTPGNPVRFKPRRIYFSDGGITSNCPIQLFDKPLPKRPTFVVNLFTAKSDEAEIRLSARFSDPESEPQRVPAAGWCAIVDFAVQIVMTALQWRDSLARTLPGYRERVLNIGVPPGLGGLNLCMTKDEIEVLADCGRKGADVLARFDIPVDGHKHSLWAQHRWLRLRAELSALQRHARELAQRVHVGQPDFRSLLSARPSPEPRLVDDAARDQGQALLDAVATLADSPCPSDIEANAPEPMPQLGMLLPY